MITDVFGPIVIAPDIEDAVKETLEAWTPTVIQEIELQHGLQRGQIALPKTYATRERFRSFPEDRMPACVVVSAGLAQEPMADGEGTFNAWFGIGVGFAAVARDAKSASFLTKVYVAAARWILVNKSGLRDADGNIRASMIEWVDESYDEEIETTDERTIMAAYVLFRVNVDSVVSRAGGPITPPDPIQTPGSDWPTAETTDVEVVMIDE